MEKGGQPIAHNCGCLPYWFNPVSMALYILYMLWLPSLHLQFQSCPLLWYLHSTRQPTFSLGCWGRWLNIQVSCASLRSMVVSRMQPPDQELPFLPSTPWSGSMLLVYSSASSPRSICHLSVKCSPKKGWATMRKEPGSLRHHVEGPHPIRTPALVYYISEK